MAHARKKILNRELSWLEFNHRVLEEAMDTSYPLLERVKFLSIFYQNLDEFFMIRVSGLIEQAESGLSEESPDGLSPREQLALIRVRLTELVERAEQYLKHELVPALNNGGIHIFDYADLKKAQKKSLKDYFDSTVYPVLTPLAVDPAHPFPHISNLSLSLAVVVRDSGGNERFARVKIPTVLPRLVPVASGFPKNGVQRSRRFGFVWMEQLIAANLGSLFRGRKAVASYPFRVVRDADLEIRFDEAEDLIHTIEESISRRRFGSVSKLTVSSDMPTDIRSLLVQNLQITDDEVYTSPLPLGLSDLMQLYELDLPHLKDMPFRPRTPAALKTGPDLFASIRSHDILLHHPYDSFSPIIELLETAARDPDVLAIKMSIYRVGPRPPVVDALMAAADNGKQVSVIVELKARFDEENNIGWARALEDAGVHVVYGTLDLKTHCKVLLIVRREPDEIRRYVHLGTGNYNARTARIYTDLGLLTCDADIAHDVSALFNALTGYGESDGYRKLLVSPKGIRTGLLKRIERETEHARSGRGGHIIFKMNSLTDPRSAEALYRASQEGVKIDLIVRGSCCLIPGVAGMSENIRVISIVGRFLEHHRIYYFRNGGHGQEEVWLGSADMMQRNLDGRVETLFPVDNGLLKSCVIKNVLTPYLADTVKARELHSDGCYHRVVPKAGDAPFEAQRWLLEGGESVRPSDGDVKTPIRMRIVASRTSARQKGKSPREAAATVAKEGKTVADVS